MGGMYASVIQSCPTLNLKIITNDEYFKRIRSSCVVINNQSDDFELIRPGTVDSYADFIINPCFSRYIAHGLLLLLFI